MYLPITIMSDLKKGYVLFEVVSLLNHWLLWQKHMKHPSADTYEIHRAIQNISNTADSHAATWPQIKHMCNECANHMFAACAKTQESPIFK